MKLNFFIKEIFKGKTIGRALLFATLKEFFDNEKWLNDKFSVLELGAEPASHQRTFPEFWQVKKSNYIEMKDIDFVVDAEKPFPFKNDEFDGCIFFNVLYLINNYMNCLRESLRVSKRFIMFNIPLISGIARHPKDFNRFPEDRLIEIFNSLNKDFKIEEFKIIPIGGSFSSAVSLIDSYLKFRIIRIPIYLFAILFDKLDKIIKRNCPMQYLVLIKKI
jgi:hypothetical protein